MKRTIHIQIDLWKVAYILLLIPYFEPAAFSECYPMLHTIYKVYRYTSICATVILYIVDIMYKRRMPGKMIWLVVGYSCALILSTIYNNGLVMDAILETLRLTALFLLCEMMLRKSLLTFLDATSPIMSVLVLLNLVSLFLYPNGMYKSVLRRTSFWYSNNNWLLGYDNAFIAYFLPAMMFTIIRNICLKRTIFSVIRASIICAACLFQVLYQWPVGSVISLLLFSVLSLLILLKGRIRAFNAVNYVIGNIVVFFSLVVFRIQYLLAGFIMNALGKDVTISGRTKFWDRSFKYIAQSPWFGYGSADDLTTANRLFFTSSHNQYLWILYRGGILQFIPFALMIVESTVQLYKYREKPYVSIAAAGMCCLYLMWQIEAITVNSLMLLFIFTYYVGSVPVSKDGSGN